MKHTEHEVTVPDGTKLHVDRWTPEGEVTRVVVIVHGGLEHAGRYTHVAELLAGDGALVFGPDHRGQGLSGGPRGHIDRIEDYAADLRHVIEDTAAELPEGQRPDAMPWLVFGHSMGGLISLVYLLDHEKAVPLRGAILSAPFLGLGTPMGVLQRFAVGVLGKVAPKLGVPPGLDSAGISRDPEAVAAYDADPRRCTTATPGWIRACQAAWVRLDAEVGRIELPMRWYQGTGDKVVDPDATSRLFEKLTDAEARDQTLKLYEGYYHELHNEPADLRAPVLEMVRTWIDDHAH